MKLGKRTLFVSKKDLEKRFGLPEGVEIMGVRPSSNVEQGWEFLLVSAGEVSIGDTKVTIYQEDNVGDYRRITLSALQSVIADTNDLAKQIMKGIQNSVKKKDR